MAMTDQVLASLPRGNRGATENNPDYTPVLASVSDETRKLFEEYSGIAPDEVIPHCMRIRDEAWQVWPFPCIGRFRFLVRSITNFEEYPEILERIKMGQKFLDLGCCFGQDVRHLAAGGAPHSNIYGSDLSADYLNLGYDLFRDRETLKATFFAANIFDTSPEAPLNQYDGFFDIVQASSFFHLFDYERQTKAAIRALKLLKNQPGSMLLGRQFGVEEPGTVRRDEFEVYAHDKVTLDQFWRKVTSENGFKADVLVERHARESEEDKDLRDRLSPGSYRLVYRVRFI